MKNYECSEVINEVLEEEKFLRRLRRLSKAKKMTSEEVAKLSYLDRKEEEANERGWNLISGFEKPDFSSGKDWA